MNKNLIENEKNEIKKIFELMWKANIEKDIKTLELILDDSYELIHMDKHISTKEIFLDEIKNEIIKYFSAEIQSTEINLNNNLNECELISKTKIDGFAYKKPRQILNLKLIQTLKKINNKWIFIKTIALKY